MLRGLGIEHLGPQRGRGRPHLGDRAPGARRVLPPPPHGHGQHLHLLQGGYGAAGRHRGGPIPDGHRPLPLREPHGGRGLRLRALRGPPLPAGPPRPGAARAPQPTADGPGAARTPVAPGRPRGRRDRHGGGGGPRYRPSRSWTTPTSPFSGEPAVTLGHPGHPAQPVRRDAGRRQPEPIPGRPRPPGREPRGQPPGPSSTTSCSASASSHSSRTASPRDTRPRSRSRRSPTPTTPSGRGRCWRRPATRTASTSPCTGRPTSAARISRTWCWRSRRI